MQLQQPSESWIDMFKATNLVRPHILHMPSYSPVLPFEVLSEQLGIPANRLIKMDANENPYGPLPEVRQALANIPFPHIYPDPESRELRAALANFHKIPIENILAGAGADELIDLLMRLFIEPGDALLTCPPTFGMYAFDGDVNGAQLISVPRRKDFSLDTEGIERAVHKEKPKLIFIASPNNPDGSLAGEDTLLRLLELPAVIVLDEAYIDFASPGCSWLTRVPSLENLVVLRTFSKWAGLAGMRVGYGVFPTNLMPYFWKIKQPYNVSVAAAAAAMVSLKNASKLEEIGKKIVAERQALYKALQEFSWLQPYPSQANFILCRVIGRQADQIKKRLASFGILIRYFDQPYLRDHLRISVGRPEDRKTLVKALKGME
jgi:histidinol-phosphate aminotransferase